MLMTEQTRASMNKLAGECFNANAIIDNLAYNLDFYYFNEIAKVVHLGVAHIMPEWADLITDKMLELNARPVRVDIQGYAEDIQDLKKIFNILEATLLKIRNSVRELIEDADMSGDDEVRIFGENFLECHVTPYLKQANEWVHASNVLDPQHMNIHIGDYTHFIKY